MKKPVGKYYCYSQQESASAWGKFCYFSKGTYYWGITIFNSLPTDIKALKNDHKKLKTALKHVLYLHSFYTVDEYFNR